MPRTARIDFPGMLHHVRVRGIERGNIFLSDRDRNDFLDRLTIACTDGAASIYAWSLMSNHFHLAIRTGTSSLSRIMSKVLTGYAVSFNRRNKRVGHLFQNRFKSTVVEEEQYFLALVRYIHLNPVRAGMVEDLDSLGMYTWTGHRALMDKKRFGFQEVDEVLGRFGLKAGAARHELVKFMGEQLSKNEQQVFKGGGLLRSAGGVDKLRELGQNGKLAYDDRILGSSDFVESVLTRVEPIEPAGVVSLQDRLVQFDKMIESVCKLADISKAEITGGGRRRELVSARDLVSYLAVRKIGITGAKVALLLGIKNPSVSKSVARGEKIILKQKININEIITQTN